MTDYIKREDAIKAVANNYWHGTECECYAFAHKALDGIKSADVAPVRHGRWKHERLPSTSGGSYEVIRCSECQWQFPIYETRYCPSCNARMDSEKKNCDTCKHYDKGWDDAICDECTNVYSNWERKDDDD